VAQREEASSTFPRKRRRVSRPAGQVLRARSRGAAAIHPGRPWPAASCGLPASIGRAAAERSGRPPCSRSAPGLTCTQRCPRRRVRRQHAPADGRERAHSGRVSCQVRAAVRRGDRKVAGSAELSAAALSSGQSCRERLVRLALSDGPLPSALQSPEVSDQPSNEDENDHAFHLHPAQRMPGASRQA
jgi:hypothetical protein